MPLGDTPSFLSPIQVSGRRYPDSNLLGGYGLVFGPLYWVGFVFLTFSDLDWVAGVIRRKIRRGSMPESDSSVAGSPGNPPLSG